MEDILDDFEEIYKKPTFATISLCSSLIAILSFTYLMYSMPSVIKVSEGLRAPSMLVIRLAQGFTIISLVTMVLSYTKQESSNWKKSLAAVLSLLILLVVFGTVAIFYFLSQ